MALPGTPTLELAGNLIERAADIFSEAGNRTDNYNGDQRSHESVFDRGHGPIVEFPSQKRHHERPQQNTLPTDLRSNRQHT